ncbi:tyrosine-protein phosphatase [Microbacterium sp. ET2]|uniref:tyrosine-protein phosphatase n=1 Tax=Microbacterium albipurpureum TaxID=3050384 RepID=UPI00259CB9E9|nr:tyrosine-protein phosphatase [Microbacterium sp. ET2 (Ac-2212)]WJL95176.1 tyrosine-protein phosphatase [Microbacterium sp. ET2 (Ac-2212)]
MTSGDPHVPGSVNLRDTGGLPAGRGRTRFGVLFRSGNLAQLHDDGVSAIGRLGIRTIVDLRAHDEVAHAPSRIDSLPVATAHVPLFLGSVTSFFSQDMSLSDMYRSLAEESGEQIVAAIRAVLGDPPALVHCTVGKDRTGVTVAIALAAAGVDREAIIADYARTEGLLPEWRNRDIVARLKQRHPEAVHLEELATRSPAPVMRAFLDDLEKRYGSAAGFLLAHGLTDQEVQRLRGVLVEEDGTVAERAAAAEKDLASNDSG